MAPEASTATAAFAPVADADAAMELPQRQRLLLGMAQTVAKHGYRGATITEVVRFAKVSKRTFYEEFGDKESCFLELYEQTAQGLEQLIVDRTDLHGDWSRQLQVGARAYYSALTVQPRLTRAFFIEIATLSERATQRRRETFDHFALLLCELVNGARAAHPETPSRPLTPMMAAALIGGMTDVMIGAIEKDEMEERLDELVEVCADLMGTIVTGGFPVKATGAAA